MSLPFDKQDWQRLRFKPQINSVLEIWSYFKKDGAEIVFEPISNHLNDKDLSQWLDVKHEPPAGRQTVSGLRLILGDCPPTHDLPFSLETFKVLLHTFSLPSYTARTMVENVSQFAKFSTRHESGKLQGLGFVFKIGIHSTGYYTLSMNYDPESHLTTGLLLAQGSNPDIGGLLALMKDAKELSGQPMLLPVMVSELGINVASTNINNADMRLSQLEETTGQHAMLVRPGGDNLKIEFLDTTRLLNGISAHLDISDRWLNANLLVFEATKQWSELLMEPLSQQIGLPSPNSEEVRNKALKQQQMSLDEHTEYLISRCKSLLLKYKFNKRRAVTQLAVVYHFMSHKSNLLNVQIAMAAKRDSTAMKAISLLTMVFLPATFIAAFFTMPLFNGDAENGHSVFNYRFKYFWLVSIPLTCLVVLIWMVWTALRDRLTEKEYASGDEDGPQQRLW